MKEVMMNWILEIEGGFTQDHGNPTFRGISTRSYPELSGAILAQTLSVDEVSEIYYRDYFTTITGWNWLLTNAPALQWLLFTGKVHGSGDNDLTRSIQTYLNSATNAELIVDGIWGPKTFQVVSRLEVPVLHQMVDVILTSQPILTERRVQAVGYDSDGIRNRVTKEFDFAKTLRIDPWTAVVKQRRWDSVKVEGYQLDILRG